MTQDNPLKRIDLTDDEYEIRQSLYRNKYSIYDTTGNLVLKTKQKLFKVKEEFPFTDPDGDAVFTVKAQNLLDIAGDYAVTDAETDDVVATLSKNFTFVMHKWQVKDPDGNVQAVIKNENKAVQALRSVIGLANLIPHSYVIETPDGTQLGTIKGHFSIRDRYTLRIQDSGNMSKEALVAAAIAVDALEGN